MRHVDLAKLVMPAGWQASAARASARAATAAPGSRSATIAADSGVWGSLKGPLGELTDRKCFYCESKQSREDFEVDHYRPKGATDADDHDGYWWLAFEPTNLRFCCTFCNQRRRGMDGEPGGGKGSSFPLGPGGVRAELTGDSLDDEWPLLLDPCAELDPPLIAFDDLGRAVPSASKLSEPIDFERACASIRLYHLNHGLAKRRREQKAVLVRDRIARASLELNRALRWRDKGNSAAAQIATDSARRTLLEIKALQQKHEEFSSLAISIVRQNIPGRPGLERILEAV
ncbi:hypothetical protein LK533_06175 [Sphingomonas sp. PL-96]|uniref:hypothetical protein n=1 Tax=Sphingomonas sp. PL-96 TaxID=2887201 RepID=UPI001E3B058C|nr:hypothetical protein [Sphingomonas sp. PL-96]MCC2976260.1 hypothetical protein [Sphingomonas sp. PL-96]